MTNANCSTAAPTLLNHAPRMGLYRFILTLVVTIWIFWPCARVAHAQDDPLVQIGIQPFSTTQPVPGGYINTMTGNLHLEIPLGSYPQRGQGPAKVALTYDSGIWVAIQPGWCCVPDGTFYATYPTYTS